ncbi:MAG: hypothetical protein K0R73_108 [Candidatus Midichloriaceae bacterium]|jgi:hypothetical protein|nr:hypothetical protein [Candidatus Midichloriaceae bacterium]
MTNTKNSASNLIDDWQKHMQEYLNDPRLAELMVDYYAKFQNHATNSFKQANAENHNDAHDGDFVPYELGKRIAELEARVEVLEKILGRILK